jgi:hypothetical protein
MTNKMCINKYCNIETIILLHNTLPVYTVCIFKQFWIPVYIYNIIKSTKWFIVNPENTYKIKVIHSQSRKHLQDKSDSVNPENTYKIKVIQSIQKIPTRSKWFIVYPENTYKIKVIHSQSRKHLQDKSDSQSIQKTPTR